MIKIYCTIVGLMFHIATFSQELDKKTSKKVYNSYRTEVDLPQKDSIIKYNVKSKGKDFLTFDYNEDIKGHKPHIGEYSAKDISSTEINNINGYELSFLLRVRDLFENNNFYPASAVAKMMKYYDDQDEDLACTATFISKRYLITAAHCIIRTDGINPDNIELKLLYDNDKSIENVSIKNIYYNKKYIPNSMDADCYDIALLEIDEPLGDKYGYLGVKSNSDVKEELNTWKTLYNISYPHISISKRYEEMLETEKNDSIRASISKEIKKINFLTPDFSSTNQYFAQSKVFLDEIDHISFRRPYSIGGQSGSSWVSDDYYFYSVISKWVEQFNKQSFDCRLRNNILSSFLQIIQTNQ